jgi:putative salt-induced outer membrane protein YdiY
MRPIALLLISAPILAQDDAVSPVKLTLDLGFVNTAGNTDVTTLNVGEKLEYKTDGLTLTQTFSVVYARTAGVTNTSQWKGGVRADYALTGPIGVYALGAYERNTFAGIDRRTEEAVGLSVHLLATDTDVLNLETGVSLNQQRATDATSTNFAAGRLALAYRRNLTETAYATLNSEFLPNFQETDDYRVNAEAALIAPISARIATKLAYTVKFDNVPQPTFQTTDRVLTAGLQVTF